MGKQSAFVDVLCVWHSLILWKLIPLEAVLLVATGAAAAAAAEDELGDASTPAPPTPLLPFTC